MPEDGSVLIKIIGDASEFTDTLNGIAKKGAKFAAVGVAAVGTAAVAATGAFLSMGDQYNQSVNQISAATGATGAELEALGDTARKVYQNNFGDSLADVADGISVVRQNTGLMNDELQKATESGFALRDTFGYGMEESSRTASALMKNFGVSAEEAYNIIAVGAQNGADQNGDLLDTLNEYSVQYAALGLSADQFVGGLISGAEAGVFSIDKVGDAVKEFNIRAKDGSKSTVGAFQTLGLNADEMMSKFAQGGDTAQEAFFEVIKALDKMEDPVEKNAAAVALFGTQYEDLEKNVLPVLGSMEDGANKTYDALGQINEVKYDDFGSAIEGTKRALQGELLPLAGEVSGAIADTLADLTEAVIAADGDLDKIGAAIGETLGEVASTAVKYLPTLVDTGMKMIDGVVTGISKNSASLAQSAAKAISTFADGAMDAFPKIVGVAGDLVIQFAGKIADELPTLIPKAVAMVTTLADWIVDNLPAITSAACDLVDGLIDGIENSLDDLETSAPDMVYSLANGIIGSLDVINASAWKLISSFIGALNDINWLEVGWDIVVAIAKGVLDGIANGPIMEPVMWFIDEVNGLLWGESRKTGHQASKELGEGVEDGTPYVIGSIDDMEKKADAALQLADLRTKAKEAGVKIPDSVAKGMESGKYAIPETVDGLKNLIKFDSAIQKAGLSGAEIPPEMASGILSGKISVEEAVAALKKSATSGLAPGGKAAKPGEMTADEYAQGALRRKSNVNKAAQSTRNTAAAGLRPNGKATKPGKMTADEYAQGMLRRKSNVNSTAEDVVSSAREKANEEAGKSTSVGKNFSSGIISGMGSKLSGIISKAKSLMRSAIEAAKKEEDSNSPSKETRDLVGIPFSQGVAVGIEEAAPDAVAAARKSVSGAIDAAQEAADNSAVSFSIGSAEAEAAARKAIADNAVSFADRARAAVQGEMGRIAASATLYSSPSAFPRYDDKRVVSLLGQLLTETQNGRITYLDGDVLGANTTRYQRKMNIITGR